jgi:hypothetical protein
MNDMAIKPRFTMNVRVIHIDGCNAMPPTLALIESITKELGLDVIVEKVLIKNVDEAKKNRLIGSPTVQINGLDIEPEVRNLEQFGLT